VEREIICLLEHWVQWPLAPTVVFGKKYSNSIMAILFHSQEHLTEKRGQSCSSHADRKMTAEEIGQNMIRPNRTGPTGQNRAGDERMCRMKD
jgi:hypothetical protein